MKQASNLDVKPDVMFSLFEEKPDVQSLPVTVESLSLHSETDLDSSYPFTEQKPDIKLFFLKDEMSACSVASPSSPDVCASVSTPSLDLNPYCDNSEWSKQQSIESVKSEPDSQACSDGTTEEKPCIAALRALVEEYSRNEEKKDEEVERTPARSTEISSLEVPKDDTCFVPSTSFQDLPHKSSGTLCFSTTSLKPEKCNGFNNVTALSKHAGIRTGKRPCKCDLCNKEFRFHRHLSYHRAFHTGEKPYLCDVCGKGFRTILVDSELKRNPVIEVETKKKEIIPKRRKNSDIPADNENVIAASGSELVVEKFHFPFEVPTSPGFLLHTNFMMEQESNPDVKPDVKFFLFEKKPDVQSLPLKMATTSLHSETDLDSSYPFTEQKPDIKLFFLKDELSACSVASPSSPHVCVSVSTPSLDLNPNCDNPEWSKQQSIESVKSEPDSQACSDGTTEEKPCIAALRALVEEYSRNKEKKDEELERTPPRSTEMSSLELPKDDTCFVPSTGFQGKFDDILFM
ncbi:Zinc finger protein 729 [Plakobranchus ocellatus]|uniref:Zinc finger protein 729 n=1 Tax=Plakobranchus ocellatus TaxID=259542 RepID=A0AAV3YTU4_9GAST|nr:Zinc finger protein 729 [Plakobranchus ocellatus]